MARHPGQTDVVEEHDRQLWAVAGRHSSFAEARRFCARDGDSGAHGRILHELTRRESDRHPKLVRLDQAAVCRMRRFSSA